MSDPKAIRASAITPQSQTHFRYNCYMEQLDPGVTLEDLFAPTFWVHVRHRLRQHDIVRCLAYDGSFDVQVTVQSVPAGGVIMRYLGGDPGVDDPFAFIKEFRARRAKPTIVPMDQAGNSIVKVQYIPATKWRLLGLNGQEVKKDVESREEIEATMGEYLKQINMRLPTAEESAAYAAAQKQ